MIIKNKETVVSDAGESVRVTIMKDEFNLVSKEQSCFRIVHRVNSKRPFLFLNNMISKHMENSPSCLKKCGRYLADKLVNEVGADKVDGGYALKEKTLFVGFAETATGLAANVVRHFKNAYYQETTRLSIDKDRFDFLEEHSHAPNQILYKSDIITNCQRIVFVEDELTTGKTLVNIITKLREQLGDIEYYVCTFLDLRTDSYHGLEDMGVRVLSLLKGSVECTDETQYVNDKMVIFNEEPSEGELHCSLKTDNGVYEPYFAPISSETMLGLESSIESEIMANLSKYDVSEQVMVLGLGAFIYLPFLVAEKLEKNGVYALSKSTSRTPLFVSTEEGYPIRSGVEYEVDGVCYHLYNYENIKNALIVCEERDRKHADYVQQFLETQGKKAFVMQIEFC